MKVILSSEKSETDYPLTPRHVLKHTAVRTSKPPPLDILRAETVPFSWVAYQINIINCLKRGNRSSDVGDQSKSSLTCNSSTPIPKSRKVIGFRMLQLLGCATIYLQYNYLLCGNKMPTRCNRGFYCRSYCLLNMFRASLCPSSGAQEYDTVVAACGILCCGFSSSWSGVELRVMRPVCRMLQHPANRTHKPQLHTRPAT